MTNSPMHLPRDLPYKISLYCRIKLKISPIALLNTLTPETGSVLDAGCGLGLGSWIISSKPGLRVRGLDLDERKIAIAQKYFSRENTEYVQKNIMALSKTEKYDVIVISDIFYLIPLEQQEKILSVVAQALNQNGLFILKEMDTQPSWKYWINQIQETVAVKLTGFTLGKKFYFRSRDAFEKCFLRHGLRFHATRIDGYCYPHIYYLGRMA